MGYSIPSTDMLAICLIMADFDLDISVGEIMRRVERHQEANNCFFGVYDGDFRTAFFTLAMSTRLVSAAGRSPEGLEESLRGMPLRNCVAPILRFNGFYTKDTDSYWSKDEDFDDASEYNYAGYNSHFRRFFRDPVSLNREAIVDFFESVGIGDLPLKMHFRSIH